MKIRKHRITETVCSFISLLATLGLISLDLQAGVKINMIYIIALIFFGLVFIIIFLNLLGILHFLDDPEHPQYKPNNT